MQQVDPPGNGQDSLDSVDEFLAGRPGVAGVQTEADPHVADAVPQPGDRVEVAGHRMVAAGGVLQVDGHIGIQRLQRLHPTLEPGLDVFVVRVATVDNHRGGIDLRGGVASVLQDLARRDPNAVVR